MFTKETPSATAAEKRCGSAGILCVKAADSRIVTTVRHLYPVDTGIVRDVNESSFNRQKS